MSSSLFARARAFGVSKSGLKIALLISTSWASITIAQAQNAADLSAQASPIEQVIVTGSRGQQRTVTDSPTPVDVIGGTEVEQAAQGSVLGALNTLIPSFNEPARAGGATATIIETGGLRGLNPDQTLVLVNGKRRHKTALINAVSSLYNGSVPADLDMIPASAIDHIEVLRDGAAAQYGSDAIAGVINIILRNSTDGADLSASAGEDMNRGDGQLYTGLGHVGFDLGEGFLDLSASTKVALASNRANPVSPTLQLYNSVGGGLDPREATINRLVTTNYGTMPQRSLDTAYNAQYDVNGDVQLYSFGTFSRRISDLNATFRAPNNTASLPELYPNGFRPREIVSEIDFESAVGARGVVAGWNWDASTSYGMDIAHEDADHTLNPSLGPTSPTQFYVGTLQSSEWVNSLDVTRGFDVGGNLQVSAGLQHRQERYSIQGGDPLSTLAGTYVIPAGQGNAGARPAPGVQGIGANAQSDSGRITRNNFAAYVDLAYDPTSNLTIGAAGRFEHYDDSSGNTAIGKINARYALTDWLAFRGDINNGFRAPALAQEIYASTTGQFQLVSGVTQLLSIKALPVGSPSAVALGARPLQPETSLNYSAGAVLTPLDDFTLTLDAYSIDVYHRIEPTGTLTGAAVSAILTANGLPSNISATYFTNAINTRTQGIDAVATYKLDLGDYGVMHLNGSANYNTTSITHVIPNPPQLSALGSGYVLFDRLSRGNLTALLPKTKVSLSDSWTWTDFTLTPRFVHYGDYTIEQDNASQDRSFNAKWITDLELAWQVTHTLGVAIGADNIFNIYPSANGIYNAATGSQQFGASPPSPFGFTGGFYYGRININL